MYEIFSYGNFLSQLKLYHRSIFFPKRASQSFDSSLEAIVFTQPQQHSFDSTLEVIILLYLRSISFSKAGIKIVSRRFVYKNTVCTERLFSGKKPNWKYSYHVNTFAHKCISKFIPLTPKSDQQKYSFSLQHRPSRTLRSHYESRL